MIEDRFLICESKKLLSSETLSKSSFLFLKNGIDLERMFKYLPTKSELIFL